MTTVFTQEGILDDALQVNPQIFGNVELLPDQELNRDVCSVPLNAAIAYPITAELYDKITSQLSIELYVAISESQGDNPMKLILSSMWGAGIALGEVVDETGTEKIFFRYHNGEKFMNIGVDENHMTERINTGDWTHIIATYDSQTARVYVNGKLVACGGDKQYGDSPQEILYPAPPNQYICIGGEASGGELNPETDINMKIAYAKIYDDVLSEEEVNERYEKRNTSF